MADDPNEKPGRIFLGKSEKPEYLTLSKGNRHGLITGATGTGKTVTLQLLAEGFAKAGTAVFAADIKGDLSGIAMPGDSKPPLSSARPISAPLTCPTISPPSFGIFSASRASRSARRSRIWDRFCWRVFSN